MKRREVLLQMASRIRAIALQRHVEDGAHKTPETYRRVMRSLVTALFDRQMDEFAFVDAMIPLIDKQLTLAWTVGAYDVGVLEAEFTMEDIQHYEAIVNNEYQFVLRFAQDIADTRDAGGEINGLLARVDLWANRYNDVVNEAHVWFGGKTRLAWRLGKTEEHCDTCQRLNGIVAFASEWDASGVRPQHPPNPHL